jgi:hypothetical protein
MSDSDVQRVMTVLEEIRNNQKLQLERQAEALALQREQFALVQKQAERVERIQDRAEQLQARGAQIVSKSRWIVAIALPAVILLILYVSWLLFRWGIR